MPEKGKEKTTTVTGWVADKLKAQGKKGAEGGKAVPKIKPSGEYKTKSQATRAFVAGLFRSMKKQGKDVGAMDKGGKKGGGKKEDVAELANNMIESVMLGCDAFEVLEKSPEELRKELAAMKKKGELPGQQKKEGLGEKSPDQLRKSLWMEKIRKEAGREGMFTNAELVKLNKLYDEGKSPAEAAKEL